ncbi:MAG TPA: YbgC/FadM family acyl-CoA thioesterase [Rhodospirillales bacterium]|nr:YbgC/FadM family acyl-CoA thioesterase [Rhodospirillales bacterium]
MSGAGDPHVFPIRVYFEDTDAGGIVYYANYLKFAERARTEMMRSLGVESSHWLDGEGVVFAVRRCDADYRRPARLDDLFKCIRGSAKLAGLPFNSNKG